MSAEALADRLEGLVGIGYGPRGTTRLAWTPEDEQAGRWFREQAAGAGLSVERDPAGNLWAVPDSPPPWWALGSHLDSVRQGGPYDGALGVAAAFEAASRAGVPVAVISFADEEGARFNTPTFGSRALVGRPADLGRADDSGTTIAEAMRAAGVDPDAIASAPEWLARLRGFLELHIDQTTELARTGRPAGVVRGLVARMRVRAVLTGRADHSGTTPPGERRDALAAAARLIVAALDAAGDGLRATASRIEVEPNALTTVPALARLWMDARSPDAGRLERWRAKLTEAAEALPVAASLRTESESPACEFDPALRARLVELSAELGEPAPEVDCYAGHDAGLLAPHVPAAMVFVRNESGISHSPEERIHLGDAAFATELLLRLVEELAG